jgi:hypothetical protein
MIGTADPVDVWVLLEYRPTWAARALEESELAPATRTWLERNLAALARAGLKARPQLIRQPEIDSDLVRLLIGSGGELFEYSGRGYDFLLDLDLPALVANPAAQPRVDEDHYFVCTNGQRDLCCARFGLPTYAALRERVGARAWQVTHLGGHRFAPNVLVLPQGAVYGRVAGAAVDDLVEAVEQGGLCFPLLRGRSRYAPAVQAAEALSGRSDLRLAAVEGDAAHARVTFAAPDGPLSISVCRADEPVCVLKSCADEGLQPVHPYRAA